MDVFKEPISEIIWDLKYRYRYENNIIDHTIDDTWQRIAKSIAKAEISGQRKHWQQQFYSILENFSFLPGGRIIAGAGTKHIVTLFNCFVMPVFDSLDSVFTSLKEAALTLQEGGGVGYDFSNLSPEGFPNSQGSSLAPGPVSFMRIWNTMCATLQSTGARRGAMMGILRCDHPDIELFINAKKDPRELRHFNVSVLISDEFINAVKHDLDWDLVFPVVEGNQSAEVILKHWGGSKNPIPCLRVRQVKAKTLWEKILHCAYDYAEPGVIFEDTINRMNNLWYQEWISATNPCGEIPLPAYGACNLGALNLTQFITNPYSTNACIDWDKLKKTTQIATRFLDNVINVSRYPLRKQKAQAVNSRRIGLGITGLADVFVMLGIRYGSDDSLKLARDIMQTVSHTTWQASIELAIERGSFPFFDKEKFLQGEFVRSLPNTIQQDIANFGIRNSHHNTIAPTGTISLLANNVSNGIEPIFSGDYRRTVRMYNDEQKEFLVKDYSLRQWQKIQGEKFPPAWITAHDVSPDQHLQMQAVMQPFIDNAISKTINISENFPLSQLTKVYSEAYALQLKGCTIFRPNSITGSVLTLEKPSSETDPHCPTC